MESVRKNEMKMLEIKTILTENNFNELIGRVNTKGD